LLSPSALVDTATSYGYSVFIFESISIIIILPQYLIEIKNKVEENKDNANSEIYSQRIKAGKRTYFFDIKSTKANDHYLTITESKKRFKDDGYFYEKHKIFLYKEDFIKFIDALNNAKDYMKNELDTDFDAVKTFTPEEQEESGTDLKWE